MFKFFGVNFFFGFEYGVVFDMFFSGDFGSGGFNNGGFSNDGFDKGFDKEIFIESFEVFENDKEVVIEVFVSVFIVIVEYGFVQFIVKVFVGFVVNVGIKKFEVVSEKFKKIKICKCFKSKKVCKFCKVKRVVVVVVKQNCDVLFFGGFYVVCVFSEVIKVCQYV